MTGMAEELKRLDSFQGMCGADDADIEAAEAKLGLSFAEDYREYLAVYALASANGHELTGLCEFDRLNVIKVTEQERELHAGADSSWYVLERIGVDGALAWQAYDGSVFVTTPRSDGVLVAHSLLEYMSR